MGSVGARSKADGDRRRNRLLMIDDDEKLVTLMREYLESHGFELASAGALRGPGKDQGRVTVADEGPGVRIRKAWR